MSTEPTVEPTVPGEGGEDVNDGEESDEYDLEVRESSLIKSSCLFFSFFFSSFLALLSER